MRLTGSTIVAIFRNDRSAAFIAFLFPLLSLTAAAQAPDEPVKKKASDPPYKSDPQLQVKYTGAVRTPTVPKVLAFLEELTSLKFTSNDLVETKGEAWGGISGTNIPAWAFMRALADSKAVQGHWEKTADGYHLVGTLDKAAQEARLAETRPHQRAPRPLESKETPAALPDPPETTPAKRAWRVPALLTMTALVALFVGTWLWRRRIKK
jgi:hypothetical protein